MGVPFLFDAVCTKEGDRLVDAALIHNCPLWCFDQETGGAAAATLSDDCKGGVGGAGGGGTSALFDCWRVLDLSRLLSTRPVDVPEQPLIPHLLLPLIPHFAAARH
jgi:hypothetical protein